LTSIRKSNFNNLATTGLVRVKTDGPDTVLAYGAKPSVGGQSQRTIFRDHEGFDCIVHFHCPLKTNGELIHTIYRGEDVTFNRSPIGEVIAIVSQREVECGSHQCGKNTSNNLTDYGDFKVVMLDNHGPNIVFKRSIDPQIIIEFIERNFDLGKKTGGYNL